MNEEQREQLKEFLANHLTVELFDGCNEEHIYYGIEFKGLHNMTDDELIEQAKQLDLYNPDKDVFECVAKSSWFNEILLSHELATIIKE